MRVGFNYWIGSLSLFLSVSSFSNPFYAALSNGIAESLVASGISQNQARMDADSIVSKRFEHNLKFSGSNSSNFGSDESIGKPKPSTNTGEVKEKSVIQDLFSEGVKNSFDLRNGSGDRGIIYDVVENGTEADMEKLKKHFSEHKITFKHGVTAEQTYKLTDLFTSQTFQALGYGKLPNNLDVTVAPLWYEQMGMSVYRTESPIIKRDGIPYYVFFDSLYSLYSSGFGYGFLKFPHVESVTTVLGKNNEGNDVIFEIYRERPDIYSDEADADLSEELTYHNIYRFTYAFERAIRDYSANFEEDLEYFKVDQCSGSDDFVNCVYNGLTNNASIAHEFLEEGRGEINIVKPDMNISQPEEKKTESDDFDETEKVSIYESFDGAVLNNEKKSVFGDDYFITNESMADAANNVVKQVKDSEIDGISDKSKEIISRGDFKVEPKHYGGSTGGNSGVRANDLAKSSSSGFSEFNKAVKERREYLGSSTRLHDKPKENKLPVDTNAGESTANTAEKERDKLAPSQNTATGSSSSGSNVGGSTSPIGGTNTGGNTGTATGSGSISGSSSTSSTNSISKTDATTAPNAVAKSEGSEKENEDGLNLPALEDFDVLKPLRDWRESLMGKVHGVNISGTCPALSLDIFGSAVSTQVHCDIFENIRGILTAVMSLVWSFVAFRIVFEA